MAAAGEQVRPGIVLDGVSKSFARANPHQVYTLQETVLRGFRRGEPRERFWALREVSFGVESGQLVGVIGRNGAGKSSLLRLVGGIGKPDGGTITVTGRMGALIDLGAGYHPELTGRENVILNGVISGRTRKQMAALMDEIVAFAELEPFLDNPVRTYSSGMQLRLAFAVAVAVDPEVLLVDEVLAVGDLAFQRKCLDRIDLLRSQGAAILFVTHDLGQAEQRCDRVVWLDGGRVAASGPAAQVVGLYRDRMQQATAALTPSDGDGVTATNGQPLVQNVNRFGSLEVVLEAVWVRNLRGDPVERLPADEGLVVDVHWRQVCPVEEVVFSVAIQREDHQLACEVFSPVTRLPGEAGQLRLTFGRLDLNAGQYFVNVGAYRGDWAHGYDYHWQVYPLMVDRVDECKGMLRPPFGWEMG